MFLFYNYVRFNKLTSLDHIGFNKLTPLSGELKDFYKN